MSLIAAHQLPVLLSKAQAKDAPPEVFIDSTLEASYPVLDLATRTVRPGIALAARVADGAEVHTVVLAACRVDGGLAFHLGCGDKFFDCLHGLEPAEAKRRCSQAVPASKPGELAEMMSSHALFPASNACDFYPRFRANQDLCDHTACFLVDLASRHPDLGLVLEQKLAALELRLEESDDQDEMGLDFFAFRAPVLLLGERGSGKTTLARDLAASGPHPYFEMPGHAEVDATDMLGALVPYGKGELIWKDAPVAAAFRSATTQKTVLAFDEMLRIDQRQLSFLLTTLSPWNGKYRLRTGRVLGVVDGVAQEEVLECPTENLCVIATSNIGMDYAVTDIDPALADRFVVIDYNATRRLVRKYVLEVCRAKGYSSTTAERVVESYARLSDLRKAGALRYGPSARLMVHAVRLANMEAQVPGLLKRLCIQLVAREMDGTPSKAQLEDLNAVISRCFGENA